MDELTPTEASQLLTSEQVAHIGVVDDGVPYVTPVSYVIVEGEFCFRTGAGRRVDALRENPSVSIEVMRLVDGRWECVIASGTAREISDSQQASVVISELLKKYSEQIGSSLTGGARTPMPEPGIIVAVKLSEISGRSSGSWFSIPTRPGRL